MSQPLIIGAISIAVIDTTIADLTDSDSNGPQLKIIIGGFVVLVTLLALSDYREDIADSLAILILLATVIGPKGGAISHLIDKLTGDPKRIGDSVVQGAVTGLNIASSKSVKQS